MRFRRLDLSKLDTVRRTDEGYLRAPGNLTRTGVFEYRRGDGTMQRELRLADDVFAPAAVASFDLKPLTNDHPPSNLDPSTVRHHAVGVIASPRKGDDGQHVSAELVVMDASAIAAVEAGKRELSCGYTCELEAIPGGVHRYADGTEVKADFYQRQIKGNHVALVDAGRAGPSASIRLDSAGHAVTRDDGQPPPRIDIKIDGTTYSIPEPDARRLQAIAAELAAMHAEEPAAEPDPTEAPPPDESLPEASPASGATQNKGDTSELDRLRGENAALKAQKASKARADAALVTRRLELVARVQPILDKPAAELVTLDDRTLMLRTIALICPELKLDAKASDERIAGAFEGALSGRSDSALQAARVASKAGEDSATREDQADPQTLMERARNKVVDDVTNAWRHKPKP